MSTETDINVWKAKAISRGKLLERFRDLIMNMADHVQNEGDRIYFGSTNDYDELRAIGQEMDMWNWDRIIRERPERDPYADCRQLRETMREIQKSIRNARGAIESNQVVDKDVHGTLTAVISKIEVAVNPPPATRAEPTLKSGQEGKR